MATKKHLQKIIILSTVLFVFSILLYLQNLQKVKPRQIKAKNVSAEPRRENMLKQLPGWDREKITAISVVHIGGEHSSSGGESSRLELQKVGKSEWQLNFPPGISGIPVRRGAVATLADNAFGLWGKKLIGSFNLKQKIYRERYGFDQTKLTLDYFGQTRHELIARILVGGQVPGLGGYYATVISGAGEGEEGKNKREHGHLLFRLPSSVFASLAVNANALRKRQLPELTLLNDQRQHLNILELRSRKKILRIEKRQETQKYRAVNELVNFVMTRPYPTVQGVDQYHFEQLLKNMPNPVRIIKYIEDRPRDLKIYGLDKARNRQTIYIEDSRGRVLNLALGKEADIHSVYAMQSGYDSVFTISKDVLAILDFVPFLLVDKFVALIDIDKTEKVQLRVSAKSNYALQIIRPPAPAKDHKNHAGSTKVDGGTLQRGKQERRLSREVTQKLYQQFLNLFLAGEVSAAFFPVDKAEVSLLYSLRNGLQRRVDFYNYSAKDYYAVATNGKKATFVTEKLQLELLQKVLAQVWQTGSLNIVK